MKKKVIKVYKYIPAYLVLLMVFLPFFANFFVSNTAPLDNRPLCTRPTALSKNFSREFEAYYNDTFAWRKSLLKKYIKLQKKLKIDTGRYFNGLDGWMFYDSAKVSDGNAIIDYKGEAYYSTAEMQLMTEGVIAARDYFAKRGVKYMLVVAPNKETVYPEFMPTTWQKVRKSDVSRADEAINYIQEHSNVAVLNLKPSQLEAKPNFEVPLYFKRDTHWNSVGGYVGYGEIVKILAKLGFELPYPKLTEAMIHEGPKVVMDMDLSQSELTYKVDYLNDVKPELVLDEDHGKLVVYKTPKAPLKKSLLMIRDSFSGEILPFISKAFANSAFLLRSDKSPEKSEKIIEDYKVDVVIDEIVERRVDKFLEYKKLYGE